MFNSILIVCTGNICRSPIAERILRSKLPGKRIDSAGVGALVDYPADENAIDVAERNGISLAGHKAVQFNSRVGSKYDLILVMEKSHLAKITEISPEASGKTMLLGHWLALTEIPDPYKKSREAFESVYKLIDKASQTWVVKLNA